MGPNSLRAARVAAKNFALATPAREKAISEGDSGGEDHCGQHCRYEDGQEAHEPVGITAKRPEYKAS